ncbi:MAG: hypothetical protein JW938_03870 [Candidatus Omnitrophica bacterium]|nr:hypothetical protein [Candidatus Omnitrophota bacterium]
MKKIIYGTLLIIVVLISVHNAYSAWGLFPNKYDTPFERYYTKIEDVYQRGIAFADKNVYVKKNYFHTFRWEHFFERWNDDIMAIKEDLRPYANEYPLVFDYFSIVLRDLHLIYLEYNGMFEGEKGTGRHMVAARQETFIGNMESLKREIEFVKKKDAYLAEEYFYRKQ